MIFRTKRGAGGYQDGLLGDSAGQDKAQFDMPGQNAAPIQDGLPGGFSLPGQSRGAGADDIQDKTRRRRLSGRLTGGFSLPGQNAAQAVIRTAYRGDSACQDKPAQMIFQDKAQMIFRTAYRGDSACQDKTRRRRLSGRLTGGIQPARTSWRSSICQDKAAAQAVIRRRRR